MHQSLREIVVPCLRFTLGAVLKKCIQFEKGLLDSFVLITRSLHRDLIRKALLQSPHNQIGGRLPWTCLALS